MKMCINRNVIIGLAAVAGGVLLFAPQAFGAMLPLLILLICPLSMIFMMRAMAGGQSSSTDEPASASSSAANAVTTDGRSEEDAELIRLRAEVDQLRAEVRDRQGSQRADEVDDRLS